MTPLRISTCAWVLACALLAGTGCDSRRYPQAGAPWTNSLGMVFLPVKGTKVLFCIWPTRVQDFAAFVDDTQYDTGSGFSPPYGFDPEEAPKARPACTNGNWKNPGFPQGAAHPVVGVNWSEAATFDQWLTQREQRAGQLRAKQKYRLPTLREMERALAYQTRFRDFNRPNMGPWPAPDILALTSNYFAWGNDWPPPHGVGNFADRTFKLKYGTPYLAYRSEDLQEYDDGYAETSPVGSFKANVNGLYDLAGNVMCWIGATYPEGAFVQGSFVINDSLFGSAWDTSRPWQLVSTASVGHPGDSRHDNVGFRCVIVVK